MRIWPFRWTMRRNLLVVAIVALALGGFLEGRTMLDRRDRYLFEANWQAHFRKLADQAAADVAATDPASMAPAYRALAAYHAERERAYRRAIARPWIVVEPDPNPPVDPQNGYPFMKDHPYGHE
jgi:hypothetical protein